MSRSVLVSCDRCGCSIRAARTSFQVETGRLRHRLMTLDLCEGCSVAFDRWLQRSDDAPPAEAATR